MANLKIQNRQNSSKVDTRFLGYSEGSVFYLHPSRYVKNSRIEFGYVGDNISKFPRNTLNEYQDLITSLDFSTGVIDGGDEISSDFLVPNMSSGEGVVAVISINTQDLLSVVYENVKTIELATVDFDSINFSKPYNMPLYSVLIVNRGSGYKIESFHDLRPDFVLGLDTETLHFTNDNNEEYRIQFLEYLSESSLAGQNQINIRNTNLQAGDSVTLFSKINSENLVVENIQKRSPLPDIITFSSNLQNAYDLSDLPRVRMNEYSNLRQALESKSKILYDSGWVAASTSQTVNIVHNLNRNIFTYHFLIYFNSVESMEGARLLTQYADTSLSQTYGVNIKMNFDNVTLKFGNNSLYHILDSSGDVLSSVSNGYYRAVAVLN
jgi:hypothetical protein